MDTQSLEKLANRNVEPMQQLSIQERCYYVALRGLYSQYRSGEITLEQAEDDKEVMEDVFVALINDDMAGKEIVYLNKQKLVDAVILETGRYIAAANTNPDREKAYPRKLFEERVKLVIDKAYDLEVSY